jgi:hypothetical protein
MPERTLVLPIAAYDEPIREHDFCSETFVVIGWNG